MIGVGMAGAGLVALLGGATHYMIRVARGDLRPPPWSTRAGVLLGAALGLAGPLLSVVWAEPLAAPLLLGTLSAAGALVALLIHSQRRVPAGDLRVAPGRPMLHFQAMTSDGAPFDSRSLQGRRVLLKFYRGEWCPFCQAELRRFSAMRSALAAHGVEVVALSCDTPAAAQAHQQRDQLDLTLLCDPTLSVIRLYGVEHHRALKVSGPRVQLMGLSVGRQPGFTAMAAPTTLLIDACGIVCWIDQTDDYKVRSSEARVLEAVSACFHEATDAVRC